MPPHRSNSRLTYRVSPLAACFALAFSADIIAAPNVAEQQSPDQTAAPQTWVVKNCDDAGTDSLRDLVTNFAQSGDTIDLSSLPAKCGMANATITLITGQMRFTDNSLTLQGPSAGQGTVTISGGGASRVLQHTGAGSLTINALTIADGYYHSADYAAGACVDSTAATGSVILNRATITRCTAVSDAKFALGAGVMAQGNVSMYFSRISGNEAIAPLQCGIGAGVHANHLFAEYSTITGNVAHDGSKGAEGGGAFAQGGMTIVQSTIDHNTASAGSALFLRGFSGIIDSTISGNIAHQFAAVSAQSTNSLTVANSTIAFNHADVVSPYGAVDFEGAAADSTLITYSSIIADNTMGASDTPLDVTIPAGLGVWSGADNLVNASNVTPPMGVVTVTADPMLGPLQFNGGWNLTHQLLPGSPARTKGDDIAVLETDQRGIGYPRKTYTGNLLIDIGAVQFDVIFYGGFD